MTKVILSGRFADQSVRNALLSVSELHADVANTTDIILAVLDDIFYGHPVSVSKNALQMLTGCGPYTLVPPERAREAIENIKDNILFQIRRSLGGVAPDMEYRYRVDELGDIYLDVREPQPTYDPEEEFKASVRQGIENGDWYPESVRRLVGM